MASPVEVARVLRRKRRERPEREPRGLSLAPLAGVLALTLGVASAQHRVSAQARQGRSPVSLVYRQLDVPLPVQVSRTGLVVDGQPVLELRDGRVDSAARKGGGADPLITPLHDIMLQHAARLVLIERLNPRRPFTGAALLEVDPEAPYATVLEVVYTLGQAGFTDVRYAALRNHRDETPRPRGPH